MSLAAKDWSDGIVGTLGECCGRRAVALVLAHDVQAVCEARFVELTRDTVQLELCTTQSLPTFRPTSLCTISFHHERRMRLFVARVRDYEPSTRGGPPARLVMGLPRQLVAQDARLTSRIPVREGAGLEVTLRAPGRRPATATPVNISAAGVLLELEDDADPPETDADVQLDLRLGRMATRVDGVVRRQHGESGLAVLFTGNMRDGVVRPPATLRDIIDHLERAWMKKPSSIPPR